MKINDEVLIWIIRYHTCTQKEMGGCMTCKAAAMAIKRGNALKEIETKANLNP